MKTKKEEYIDKMASELKEWSAKIDELETKVNTAKADAKAGYESRIRELKDQREAMTQKLRELKGSGEGAWEVLKTGMDKGWKDFKATLNAAKDKFKKTP